MRIPVIFTAIGGHGPRELGSLLPSATSKRYYFIDDEKTYEAQLGDLETEHTLQVWLKQLAEHLPPGELAAGKEVYRVRGTSSNFPVEEYEAPEAENLPFDV